MTITGRKSREPNIIYIGMRDKPSEDVQRILDALRPGHVVHIDSFTMLEQALMPTLAKPMRHGPRKKKDWIK